MNWGGTYFAGQMDDLIFFREMPGPEEIHGLYSHYLPEATIRGPESMADFDGNGFETVILDGSASRDADGSIVSYDWTESGLILGTGEYLLSDFTAGSHPVILTVTDNNGITSSDSLLIEITGADFSRWQLEENAMDSIGSNHGYLIGEPGFFTEEVMEGRYALSFDGVDDYVSIADNPSLEGMEQFSFSFWMKASELPEGICMILGKELAYRILYSSTGTFSWVIATEDKPWYSEGTSLSSDRSLGKGVWNHVVVGYDGKSTYLYLNGRLDTRSSIPLSGRIVNNANPLTLAKNIGTTVGFFNGALDDVRYFKTMLSDSSVYRLFRLYPMADTTTLPGDTITSGPAIDDKMNKVVLYPNPAGKKAFLNNLPPRAVISIYSLHGEQMGSLVCRTPEEELDLGDYPPGLYILKIRHRDLLTVRKLVISPQ